ncbi:DNA (cytosine-5)-methyltransferase 3 [Hypsizygus marmoreus]|uniref:DNA (cytosine-5-)-methyltransferase n=1 Tax=Hypsizygus marmoreus TaxID=39966 RepID=A0A369K5M5_HYPMA|nr:DNA (cytosine-5)-methyltransferase 3 [Hypsizygus marmoreus]
MARRRPNAFEVSFGEPQAPSSSGQPVASGSNSRSTSLKRKGDAHGPGESREAKRVQLPPVAFYIPQPGEVLETPDLVILGEDPFVNEDRDAGDSQDDDKPVRVLTEFTFFDPKHRNEMVSLSSIEEDDGVDRQFEGAGRVSPYAIIEEDEGQEDGLDDDTEGGVYVRLSAVLRFMIDYSKPSDPVWIETTHAWYILKVPAKEYASYYQHFYAPRRVTQLVISTAIQHPRKTYDEWLQRFVSMVDVFGRTCQEEHIWDAIPELQEAIEESDLPHLKSSPLIRQLLRKAPSSSTTFRGRAPKRAGLPQRSRNPPPIRSLLGNIDLAVLKAENQTPTHVTPLIASLAQGLVFEELVVVGVRPPAPNKAALEEQKQRQHERLCALIKEAVRVERMGKRRVVDIRREDYVDRKRRFATEVKIDGRVYKIGDFIIVPIGKVGDSIPPGMPEDVSEIGPDSTIADYFWFARVLYADSDLRKFHVQWLEHSSQTMQEELANPQELYYNELCAHIEFQTVVGKVTVHECPHSIDSIPPDEFFARFTHDKNSSSIISLDMERRDLAAAHLPPQNCPVCPLIEQHLEEQVDRRLRDEQGIPNGVAFLGQKYHLEDFVLYRAEKGPAHIGYITGVHFPIKETSVVASTLTIQRVGRISTIARLLPENVVRDERHVFLTKETTIIRIQDLIRVCFVVPLESIPDLQEWMSLSPDHFYVQYTFPNMTPSAWRERTPLSCADLLVCTPCVEEKLRERDNMREFLAHMQKDPLKTLDLFGGVGAFSSGLAEGSGCLKVTDAVEKSPSAAKTTMRNCPRVTVHNQCANVMLRHAIKTKEGHHPETPKQLFDDKTPVKGLPNCVHCITAGFPCQSHSRLNMYRRADDIKSNLILTTLSYVDFYRPKYCVFENVPGFLGFSFDAIQAGKHKLEGGVPMSGLKALVAALCRMGYQSRFALLQAGHYGTPQRRNRFFLVAALDGHLLPDIPQPTHDFPDTRGLEIKFPIGDNICPVRRDNGTAPHPFVTIDDAIGDLPRFDWKHPKLQNESAAKQREFRDREREIPALPCKYNTPHCGYEGKNVPYHHAPRTSYQLAARAKPTADIQHFTRCLLPKKVERVVSIPLAANADYRDLRPHQQEWQMANPLSSVARKNYRPGLYGRLDRNEYFPTTVTNMDPTAKQSKVLNPYCKRMVTVRELARSQGFPDHFVFESIGNNVVTMHRQIGNAVPLPVGIALGRELRMALYKKWLKARQEAIMVDDDD